MKKVEIYCFKNIQEIRIFWYNLKVGNKGPDAFPGWYFHLLEEDEWHGPFNSFMNCYASLKYCWEG
jgi:hypothetical protein